LAAQRYGYTPKDDGGGYEYYGEENGGEMELGDVVYVELPEAGTSFEAGKEMAVVESVKAAGDVKVPVAGEVVEVNVRLTEEPELVNTDPLGDGWFLKIIPENLEDLEELMDESQYHEYIGGL
jgi:glycine cleavage system H protein